MKLPAIHITDLKRGDVVRVSFRNGYHLEPKSTTTGQALYSRKQARVARSFSRTVCLAYVMDNDSPNGRLIVDIQDRNVCNLHKHYAAELLYKNILTIQKYVTSVRPIKESGPVTHPGSKALGSTNLVGLMSLAPVRK